MEVLGGIAVIIEAIPQVFYLTYPLYGSSVIRLLIKFRDSSFNELNSSCNDVSFYSKF